MRLLAVSTVLVIALFASTAQAGPLGTISGTVFDDQDGDGVRDVGEPGLGGRALALSQQGAPVATVSTDPGGAYTFENLAAGTYSLLAETAESFGVCVAPPANTFDPLIVGGCFDGLLPWTATSPNPIDVVLDPGGSVQADIGAQPDDVVIIDGRALLEASVAPPGTPVEAVFNGQTCGQGLVTSGVPEGSFEVRVNGGTEQSGCPAAGEEVAFRVGGVAAEQRLAWPPETPAFRLVALSAMERHAWYWFQAPESDPPLAGSKVEALVGQTVCGQASIEGVGPPGQEVAAVGFSKLIVPSDQVKPGCGNAEAFVSFRVDGVLAENTVQWRTGIQQIALVPGASNVEAPDTGTGTSPARSREVGLLGLGGLITLIFAAIGLSFRRTIV